MEQMKMIGGGPTYTKNVSEPWFTLISLGLKTIEGRLNKGDFAKMKIGDTIMWENSDFLKRSVLSRVVRKTEYPSFREYLEVEGLPKCLPGMPTMEHGLDVYYKYYKPEDEREHGIVAIEIEVITES